MRPRFPLFAALVLVASLPPLVRSNDPFGSITTALRNIPPPQPVRIAPIRIDPNVANFANQAAKQTSSFGKGMVLGATGQGGSVDKGDDAESAGSIFSQIGIGTAKGCLSGGEEGCVQGGAAAAGQALENDPNTGEAIRSSGGEAYLDDVNNVVGSSLPGGGKGGKFGMLGGAMSGGAQGAALASLAPLVGRFTKAVAALEAQVAALQALSNAAGGASANGGGGGSMGTPAMSKNGKPKKGQPGTPRQGAGHGNKPAHQEPPPKQKPKARGKHK